MVDSTALGLILDVGPFIAWTNIGTGAGLVECLATVSGTVPAGVAASSVNIVVAWSGITVGFIVEAVGVAAVAVASGIATYLCNMMIDCHQKFDTQHCNVVAVSYPYNPDLCSRLLELQTPTSGTLLHFLLADSQEVIPPPAQTPPSVRLWNILGPTPTSTPSRRVCKTYAPNSGPPLRNPIRISVSGTSGLSSDLGL
ncbi:uncharacterized protein EI90DRAFT_3126886 [Cantharellus anzutake]|uniref:uncharacterized protein n=1 Tax=Cantharellus anzutake TaxID=1750568 RepID=UPI0019061465|nr:uncharacterized protein EI90DRAFT_3126886 [Cantharellus anzutake]KAF8327566.1 hypothetical protein EI90DRAFT_3126886 [Cantharellus anzutake]